MSDFLRSLAHVCLSNPSIHDESGGAHTKRAQAHTLDGPFAHPGTNTKIANRLISTLAGGAIGALGPVLGGGDVNPHLGAIGAAMGAGFGKKKYNVKVPLATLGAILAAKAGYNSSLANEQPNDQAYKDAVLSGDAPDYARYMGDPR